jgi:predicted DNA-binding antitoxin AbrB/MazE fold protein
LAPVVSAAWDVLRCAYAADRSCYEEGFLKPAQSLNLRQGEKVAVLVLRHPDPASWDMKRLAVGSAEDETLASAGLDA